MRVSLTTKYEYSPPALTLENHSREGAIEET